MKRGKEEEKHQGEGRGCLAEKVHYQSLVGENTFHIYLQRSAFSLSLFVLHNQRRASHWPAPRPVYTVLWEDMLEGHRLH